MIASDGECRKFVWVDGVMRNRDVIVRRELIVYCVIGCSGVALDYAVFTMFMNLVGINYQVANAISVSCGICNNFIWNVHFNFKVKDRLFLRFCSFYCVGMVGLGISAALLCLTIEVLEFPVMLAKLGIIFVVTVVQFLLNKFITFRRKEF